MSIFKDQRVGILVDIQNLYYSAKVLHHKKVNFGQILKAGVGERKLIRAIGYGIKTLEKEAFKIQGALNKKLHMRPLPKIVFQLDTTESRADEIEKLLKEI